MTTAPTHDNQLCWTQLGLRMGYTNTESRRKEILTAAGRMTWTETGARPSIDDRPAVHVVLNCVLYLNPALRFGVAPLPSGGN